MTYFRSSQNINYITIFFFVLNKQAVSLAVIFSNLYQLLKAKKQQCELELKNRSWLLEDTEDINEFRTNFANAVLELAENVAEFEEDKLIEKMSEETHQLIVKRKKNKFKKKNTIVKVEIAELCKNLWKKIIDDTRRFNCNII